MRKPNCICKVCGTKIYRRPSQIASGSVFCSVACSGQSQRIVRVCSVCKKEFTGNKKTCSRSCANSVRVGIQYMHGRTNDKARNQSLLRERVARIRGGVCERCGESNFAILQVHHKKERFRGGSDSLNNLLLLCPNCHMTHHFGHRLFQNKKNGKVADAQT